MKINKVTNVRVGRIQVVQANKRANSRPASNALTTMSVRLVKNLNEAIALFHWFLTELSRLWTRKIKEKGSNLLCVCVCVCETLSTLVLLCYVPIGQERKAFESETMAFKLQIEFQKDHLPVTTTLIVLTNGGCVETWHLYKPESRGVAYWICNLQLLGYLWRQKRNRKFHSTVYIYIYMCVCVCVCVCVYVSTEFPRAFDFHGFINVNDSKVRWKISSYATFMALCDKGISRRR